eukprot:4309533-Pyramimonas_sp.AAC.1
MKWLSWVRGVVVTPENTTWTCSNGHRMLDYFVVDQRLALDTSLTAVLEGPWRPHLGVAGVLARAVAQKEILACSRAPPLPKEYSGVKH